MDIVALGDRTENITGYNVFHGRQVNFPAQFILKHAIWKRSPWDSDCLYALFALCFFGTASENNIAIKNFCQVIP